MKRYFKYLLSCILCVSLISSIVSYRVNVAFAETIPSEIQTVEFGGYSYEVNITGSLVTVHEYDGNKLISTTKTFTNSENITRVDNKGKKETKKKSDIIQIESNNSLNVNNMIDKIINLSQELCNEQTVYAETWKTYGKYNLQLTKNGTKTHYYPLLKYYEDGPRIDKPYTVKGKTKDKFSMILTGLVGALLVLIPVGGEAALATKMGTEALKAILSGIGVSVVSGLITKSFSEEVSATKTTYRIKFTDPSGKGPDGNYKGYRFRVKTKDSKYFNKNYYEKYAPQRYVQFARMAYDNTYVGTYSYDKYISFTKY